MTDIGFRSPLLLSPRKEPAGYSSGAVEGLALARSEIDQTRDEGEAFMFGFLRLKKHGLTPQDERLYRASYCGTCHGLRECMGLPSTLLTSYDAAFLHVIWATLEAHRHPAALVEDRRCTVFPLRRVPVQPLTPASRDALSALTVSIVAAKMRDDVEDEGALPQRVALGLLRRQSERAERILEAGGFPFALLRGLGKSQRDLERAPHPTLHELASPTAGLMAAVFGHAGRVTGADSVVPVLEALGASLGRFIYVWDAVSDRERDRKRGSFNALSAAFGDSMEAARVAARAFLVHELSSFERSLRALPLGEREAIALGLVHSLRCQVHRALPAPVARPDALLPLVLKGRHAHERGDCDCSGCDCSGCDCSGCDCKGCEGCESCGNAADCCDCCSCCGHHRCCCSDMICCWSSSGSSAPPPPTPPPPPPGPPGYPTTGPQPAQPYPSPRPPEEEDHGSQGPRNPYAS